jgi:hypothetical protein
MKARTMRGHDLDPLSLVFGAFFALVGLGFLLLRIDVADIHLERAWPVVLIGLGLLIVLLAARGPGRRDELEEQASEPPPSVAEPAGASPSGGSDPPFPQPGGGATFPE